jgi:hypothetical protein
MGPTVPMPPMPQSRADQRVGRCTPFSSCLLARQGKATGARAPDRACAHGAWCRALIGGNRDSDFVVSGWAGVPPPGWAGMRSA